MAVISRVRNHNAKWYTVACYTRESDADSGLAPKVVAKFTHEGDAFQWAQHVGTLPTVCRVIVS